MEGEGTSAEMNSNRSVNSNSDSNSNVKGARLPFDPSSGRFSG